MQLFLGSNLVKSQADELISGSALKRISVIKVSNLLVLKAPLYEQKEMTTFAQKENKRFNKAIEKAQNQIQKLQELKSTLINAAVTGKIRVWELATAHNV